MIKRFVITGTSALRAAVLCLGMLSLLVVGCGDSPEAEAQEFLENAQESFEKGDISDAIIELKNALQNDPKNAQARLLLGRIYLSGGDGPSAEKELLRAKELGIAGEDIDLLLAQSRIQQGEYETILSEVPEDLSLDFDISRDIFVARGEALLGLGSLEEARETFKMVLQRQAHPGAEGGLARVALMEQDFETARAHIDSALALERENNELMLLDAEWYFAQGDYEEALTSYEKAIKLAPGNTMAKLGQLRATMALGRLDEADTLIEPLKQRAPNNRLLILMESSLRFAQRNFREAKQAAEHFLLTEEQNPTALYFSGVSSYQLGELQAARARLEQYLNIDPKNDQARMVLGATELRLGDPEQAYATAKTPSQNVGDNLEYLSLLSSAAFLSGDREAAIGHLETLAQKKPDDAGIQERLGLARIAGGDLAGAQQAFERALELEPTRTSTMSRLSALQLEQKNYGEALRMATAIQTENPELAMGFILEGAAQLGTGDRNSAKEAFLMGLQKEPDNVQAGTNLAGIYQVDGEIDKAREVYDALLENVPGNDNVLFLYARMEQQARNLPKVESLLQTAIAANPDAVLPNLRLGNFYLVTGRPAEALKTAESLIKLHPDSGPLLEVLGKAQFDLGQTNEAIATSERLTRMEPNSAAAQFLLARAYAQGRQFDKTLSAFDKALEIDPNHYPTRVAYARFAMRQKDFDRSQSLIESLENEAQGNPEVMQIAGELAILQEDPATAVDYLENAQRIFAEGDRYSSSLTTSLATAYWQNGDREQSLTVLQDWLARAPNDASIHLNLALRLMALDRTTLAAERYKRVIELQPANWVARNDFAMLLYAKGDYQAAKQHAEAAFEGSGDNPAVMDTLGVILLAKREVDRAVPLLQKASELLPDNPEIALHLSQAMVEAGDNKAAKEVLDRFLSQSGRFNAREEMEKLREKLIED